LILLDNALKYTPAQGKISVSLTQDAQQVILAVTDTGAGIPAEDLPLIWERFYKVDKAHTRENHGTGLGLSIARQIVEAHGGTSDAASTVGQGTTFTVRLPSTPDSSTSGPREIRLK